MIAELRAIVDDATVCTFKQTFDIIFLRNGRGYSDW